MQISRILALTFTVAATGAPFVVRAADVETLPDANAATGQLAQQCLKDLQAFDNELTQVGFGVLAPGGYGAGYSDYGIAYGVAGTAREKMQSLRAAAYVYALDADEQSCQNVLASMRDIYQNHQGLVGSDADNPEMSMAWRRAHLAQAIPVVEMGSLMRADVVIGSDIRTPADEELGEIEDVVIDPARQSIAYVLASRGGFFGIGAELVAIPWSDLSATSDHEMYVLGATPEAFAAAPKVARGNFGATSSAAWREALDEYWTRVMDK